MISERSPKMMRDDYERPANKEGNRSLAEEDVRVRTRVRRLDVILGANPKQRRRSEGLAASKLFD